MDKRVYKGTFPTCHDFNTTTASADGVLLLIGFSAGQIQLIDPIKKEFNKLFNEEVRLRVFQAHVHFFKRLFLSTEIHRQNESDLLKMGPWFQ